MNVVATLKTLKPILKKRFGVRKLGIFGSAVRSDFTNESDIDIAIVEIDKKDLFLKEELRSYLESIFHRKVDINYYDTIKTYIKKKIEKEIVYV